MGNCVSCTDQTKAAQAPKTPASNPLSARAIPPAPSPNPLAGSPASKQLRDKARPSPLAKRLMENKLSTGGKSIDSEAPRFEGLLWRFVGTKDGWMEKMCILETNIVTIYNPGNVKPGHGIDAVSLHGLMEEDVDFCYGARPFLFEVRGPVSQVFAAHNDDECETWIGTLQRSIRYYLGNTTPSPPTTPDAPIAQTEAPTAETEATTTPGQPKLSLTTMIRIKSKFRQRRKAAEAVPAEPQPLEEPAAIESDDSDGPDSDDSEAETPLEARKRLATILMTVNPHLAEQLQRSVEEEEAKKLLAEQSISLEDVAVEEQPDTDPVIVAKLKLLTSPALAAPYKESLLSKQGGRYKTWKERWCILEANCIRYYKVGKVGPSHELGVIDMAGLTDRDITAGKEFPDTFLIACKPPQRTYVLAAATTEDFQDWLVTLKQSVNYFYRMSRLNDDVMNQRVFPSPVVAAIQNPAIKVGTRVVCVDDDMGAGVVRFMGTTQFADGQWLGIELDRARGENAGSKKGTRYFTCASDHGVFIRPSRCTPFLIQLLQILQATAPALTSAGVTRMHRSETRVLEMEISNDAEPKPSTLPVETKSNPLFVKKVSSPRVIVTPLPEEAKSNAIPPAPQKKGLLYKQGGSWKSWKERWFVLEMNVLRYFDPKNTEGPELGQIVLHGLHGVKGYEIRAVEGKGDRSYQFEIDCPPPQRTFVLAASNESDREDWLEILRASARHFVTYPQLIPADYLRERTRTEGKAITSENKTERKRATELAASDTTPAEGEKERRSRNTVTFSDSLHGRSESNSHAYPKTTAQQSELERDITAITARNLFDGEVRTPQAVIAPTAETVITLPKYEGMLWKQGGGWKSWKERFLVLEKNVITYYDSREMAEVMGTIDLKGLGVSAVVISTAEDDKPYMFEVRCPPPQRTFVLAGYSSLDRSEWMRVIQDSIRLQHHHIQPADSQSVAPAAKNVTAADHKAMMEALSGVVVAMNPLKGKRLSVRPVEKVSTLEAEEKTESPVKPLIADSTPGSETMAVTSSERAEVKDLEISMSEDQFEQPKPLPVVVAAPVVPVVVVAELVRLVEKPQPTAPTYSGVLWKQGGSFKSWKERYFVLKSNVMYYYDGEAKSRGKELGTMDMSGMTADDIVLNPEKMHCFALKCLPPQRTYVLAAKSDKEQRQWMEILKESVIFHQQRAEQPTVTQPMVTQPPVAEPVKTVEEVKPTPVVDVPPPVVVVNQLRRQSSVSITSPAPSPSDEITTVVKPEEPVVTEPAVAVVEEPTVVPNQLRRQLSMKRSVSVSAGEHPERVAESLPSIISAQKEEDVDIPVPEPLSSILDEPAPSPQEPVKSEVVAVSASEKQAAVETAVPETLSPASTERYFARSPSMEGSIYKQGGSIKTWKERWCVLKENALYYSEKPKGKELGVIVLHGMQSTAVKSLPPADRKNMFVVECVPPQRHYVFSAKDEQERAKWLSVLRDSIEYFSVAASAEREQRKPSATVNRSLGSPIVETAVLAVPESRVVRAVSDTPVRNPLFKSTSPKTAVSVDHYESVTPVIQDAQPSVVVISEPIASPVTPIESKPEEPVIPVAEIPAPVAVIDSLEQPRSAVVEPVLVSEPQAVMVPLETLPSPVVEVVAGSRDLPQQSLPEESTIVAVSPVVIEHAPVVSEPVVEAKAEPKLEIVEIEVISPPPRLPAKSVDSPASLGEAPTKRGLLKKQGGAFKSWHKRMFVLEKNILFYYDPDRVERGQELGTIPLRGLSRADVRANLKKEGLWEVNITSPPEIRVYQIIAKTNAERDSWIAACHASIDFHNPARTMNPMRSATVASSLNRPNVLSLAQAVTKATAQAKFPSVEPSLSAPMKIESPVATPEPVVEAVAVVEPIVEPTPAVVPDAPQQPVHPTPEPAQPVVAEPKRVEPFKVPLLDFSSLNPPVDSFIPIEPSSPQPSASEHENTEVHLETSLARSRALSMRLSEVRARVATVISPRNVTVSPVSPVASSAVPDRLAGRGSPMDSAASARSSESPSRQPSEVATRLAQRTQELQTMKESIRAKMRDRAARVVNAIVSDSAPSSPVVQEVSPVPPSPVDTTTVQPLPQEEVSIPADVSLVVEQTPVEPEVVPVVTRIATEVEPVSQDVVPPAADLPVAEHEIKPEEHAYLNEPLVPEVVAVNVKQPKFLASVQKHLEEVSDVPRTSPRQRLEERMAVRQHRLSPARSRISSLTSGSSSPRSVSPATTVPVENRSRTSSLATVPESELSDMLFAAISSRSFTSVKALIRQGVSLSTRNKDGLSPLLLACSVGELAMVKLMLDNKADLGDVVEDSSDSALHLAASIAHPDLIQFLLQANMNPSLYNAFGLSPLLKLVSSAGLDSADVVTSCDYLMVAGASLSEIDPSGQTVLHIAAQNQDVACIKTLFSSLPGTEAITAALKVKDKQEGLSVLHAAVSLPMVLALTDDDRARRFGVVDFIVSTLGASANPVLLLGDAEGTYPHQLASRNGFPPVCIQRLMPVVASSNPMFRRQSVHFSERRSSNASLTSAPHHDAPVNVTASPVVESVPVTSTPSSAPVITAVSPPVVTSPTPVAPPTPTTTPSGRRINPLFARKR